MKLVHHTYLSLDVLVSLLSNVAKSYQSNTAQTIWSRVTQYYLPNLHSAARQDLFVTHFCTCELLLSLLMMLFYISPAFLRTNMFVITRQDATHPPTVANDVEIRKSSRVTMQAFCECGFVQTYCNNRSLHLNIYTFKHGLKTFFIQIL